MRALCVVNYIFENKLLLAFLVARNFLLKRVMRSPIAEKQFHFHLHRKSGMIQNKIIIRDVGIYGIDLVGFYLLS